MRTTGIAVAVLLLAGCAISQADLRLMEAYGDIKVAPSAVPGADYQITVRNTVGFGYNGALAEDRLAVAQMYLQTECKASKLVKETSLQTGTYLQGSPAVTYFLDMACER